MLEDLDMLDAETLGEAGDAYLEAHPEIARGSNGRPLRGMLLPLSASEKADWAQALPGSPAPTVAYQGPSLDDLKKRDPATYNDAERYWIASVQGDIATAHSILREAELRFARDNVQSELDVSRAETDLERKKRELAESKSGLFGSLGQIGKYLPWVVGGVVVIAVGSVAVPVVVPLLAARRVLR